MGLFVSPVLTQELPITSLSFCFTATPMIGHRTRKPLRN